ncbi:hypothetical protein DNTS_014633 [Danionella cerebrum]|uniref:Uncharacterized protein n=1 Tax=Danionella cerebrum TaxID=2873325 RepID=A0A553R8J0_9TELE|nr:hypothetical protein DNTS_014633 [Danionella translucida]
MRQVLSSSSQSRSRLRSYPPYIRREPEEHYWNVFRSTRPPDFTLGLFCQVKTQEVNVSLGEIFQKWVSSGGRDHSEFQPALQKKKQKSTPQKPKAERSKEKKTIGDAADDDSDSSLDLEKWTKRVSTLSDADREQMDFLSGLDSSTQKKRTRNRPSRAKNPVNQAKKGNSHALVKISQNTPTKTLTRDLNSLDVVKISHTKASDAASTPKPSGTFEKEPPRSTEITLSGATDQVTPKTKKKKKNKMLSEAGHVDPLNIKEVNSEKTNFDTDTQQLQKLVKKIQCKESKYVLVKETLGNPHESNTAKSLSINREERPNEVPSEPEKSEKTPKKVKSKKSIWETSETLQESSIMALQKNSLKANEDPPEPEMVETPTTKVNEKRAEGAGELETPLKIPPTQPLKKRKRRREEAAEEATPEPKKKRKSLKDAAEEVHVPVEEPCVPGEMSLKKKKKKKEKQREETSGVTPGEDPAVFAAVEEERLIKKKKKSSRENRGDT